jgi:soluble lytic murein transglycosylase-like protein
MTNWVPILQQLHKTSKKTGMDFYQLLGLIMAESRFDAKATSAAGAVGLMQVMPAVAADFGVNPALLQNPELNADAACQLIEALRAKFGLRPKVIAAAYNSGGDTVKRGAIYQETVRHGFMTNKFANIFRDYAAGKIDQAVLIHEIRIAHATDPELGQYRQTLKQRIEAAIFGANNVA